MRLLQTTTLVLHEFHERNIPAYVILSHTWEDDEVLHADIASGLASRRKGYQKVVNSCKQARLDGYTWLWIDTCCIDKTSSSELSEAINSMYKWYGEARICYAFIVDVDSLADAGDVLGDFKKSRWLTRGWTLQELLAPDIVEFYDKHWIEIGTKSTLKAVLHDATGIDLRVLAGEPASRCNVATRLSWAARRQTTREEDRAYSLLGLLEVNMPLLYGEGMNAFKRLQEEVLKNSTDYTIFAWRDHDELPYGDGMLAPSPANFCIPAFCEVCTANSAFEFHKLQFRPFKALDKVQAEQSAATGRGTHMSKLPAFMGGRLQMTLPVFYAATRTGPNRRTDDRTALLYFGSQIQTGKQTGSPDLLVCLELRRDWGDAEDFCRRRIVLVPKEKLINFALEQLVLIAWRNMMSFALGNSLRASLSGRFVFENWPLCIRAKEACMAGRSTVLDEDFGHVGGKHGSLLDSDSPLVILCDHGHDGITVKEKISIQCGYSSRGPTCSVARDDTLGISKLSSLADRAQLCIASQSCKILVKVKRMPDKGNSLPIFKAIVECKRMQ